MIHPTQTTKPLIKPRWKLPIGIMESLVAYNCRKYMIPRPILTMPFWEGAGKRVFDLSGYSNHGSLISTTKWVGGQSGSELSLNGASDIINCGNNTILNINNKYTISAWINQKQTPALASFITSKGTAVLEFSTLPNNVLQLQWTAAAHFKTGNNAFQNNEWTNVVAVYDGLTPCKIYVNSINIAGNLAGAGNPATNNSNLYIGRRTDNVLYYFNGTISTVYIYNHALSQPQLKFLYDHPYFMYEIPEELYGYAPPKIGAALMAMMINNNI